MDAITQLMGRRYTAEISLPSFYPPRLTPRLEHACMTSDSLATGVHGGAKNTKRGWFGTKGSVSGSSGRIANRFARGRVRANNGK